MAKERVPTETSALISRLEQRLGLPEHYITSELNEEPSDWSFIIKLAVLVEAAVTKVIVAHLGREEMYDHVAKLGNAQRLDLALTLGVLTKGEVRTLRALADVRNAFAHRVENLNRDLTSFWLALPGPVKANLLNAFLDIQPDDKSKFKGNQGFAADGKFFRGLIFNLTIFPLISLAETDKRASEREKVLWEATTSGPELEKWLQGSFKMPDGTRIVAIPGNHDIDVGPNVKQPAE